MTAKGRLFDNAFNAINKTLAQTHGQLELTEIGRVVTIADNVATVVGLDHVIAEEVVQFDDGSLGIALNLEENQIGVILLNKNPGLSATSKVYRTGKLAHTITGPQLQGRVVNALGHPLDEKGPIHTANTTPIEQIAPQILERAPVRHPLFTGIKVVDALFPIGRGQRQLILGDRQTGKTTIGLDTILNQRDKDVICIYCAIGQHTTTVARVIQTLEEHRALEYTIVVVASAEDTPGLQFITPYAATSMAEYFMRAGQNVLIIYDDLTRHARTYRELSLLLRRPPGREAYPGDIFYIHARLLERAGQLKDQFGGGSLTAMPIIETQAQDITAYIPTNLISITDGQLYVNAKLFQRGQLPAIDVGKSVSRVGGKAQPAAYRALASQLRLAYAQFEELESFARFGTRLDETTRLRIERGRRVREVFKQTLFQPQPLCRQLAIMTALNEGFLDGIELENVVNIENILWNKLATQAGELCMLIDSGEWSSTLAQKLTYHVSDAINGQ